MAAEDRNDIDRHIESLERALDYLRGLRRMMLSGARQDTAPLVSPPRHDRYAAGRLNEHIEKWLASHGPATTDEIYRELLSGGRKLDPNPRVAMGHIETSLSKRAQRGKVVGMGGDMWDVPR
jgi:hypothetical protein